MLWKNAFGTIPNVNLLNIVDQTDPEASDEENRILETTFSTDFKSGMDSFPKSTKAGSTCKSNSFKDKRFSLQRM